MKVYFFNLKQGENLEELQQKMMETLKEKLEREVSDGWVEDGLFEMLFRIMFFSQTDVMWVCFVFLKLYTYKS